MGHKKLAQLLSFRIQICTKISTKILENIHSNWVSDKGIKNSMKLLALRVRLSPSLCQININWSISQIQQEILIVCNKPQSICHMGHIAVSDTKLRLYLASSVAVLTFWVTPTKMFHHWYGILWNWNWKPFFNSFLESTLFLIELYSWLEARSLSPLWHTFLGTI